MPKQFSRRDVLRSGAVGLGYLTIAAAGARVVGAKVFPANADDRESTDWIADPEIRAGVRAAIRDNLLPAASEAWYPGHFTISADGKAFGSDTTWPGLDSWQMAGAYLLLGRDRLVRDYFDFVRASQRKDGNIPFGIWPGTQRPEPTFLRGMKYPQDLFTCAPPKREGLPATSQAPHEWIGLFEHWQPKANPLGVLGPVCHILTAAEIYGAGGDLGWLRERMPSIEGAAAYLWSRRTENGLVGDSGFYVELPPRYRWDGITQCYAVRALRDAARLARAAGNAATAAAWENKAAELAKSFRETFWRGDHFAEYVHPERGVVDAHGLSDVNWAAVAFGIADETQTRTVWPLLMKAGGFWHGGMPTQTVTKPFSYEPWEYNEPVGFAVPSPVHDVAAMGRVWYLEAEACRRMGERERLVESARRVCRAAEEGRFWRERYHPHPDGTVTGDAAKKYCEYAAVLTRVVLSSRDWFSRP